MLKSFIFVLLFFIASCSKSKVVSSDPIGPIDLSYESYLIASSEDSLDFGVVDVGFKSNAIKIRLTNLGALNAEITNLTINHSSFKYTGDVYPGLNGSCSNIINSSTSCNLEIEFIPDSINVYNFEYTLNYIDAIRSKQISVVLSGEGVSNVFYLIGGMFNLYNGEAARILKFNYNGEMEIFNTGVVTYDHVYAMDIQEDGKVFIGGNIYRPTNVFLDRLTVFGEIDEDWLPDFYSTVIGVRLQEDKVLVSGPRLHYAAGYPKSIGRYNLDGSLDSSFILNNGTGIVSLPTGVPNVRDFILSDNKIYVVGSFTHYNNYSYNNIARMNYDGSIDLSFNVGEGVQGLGFVATYGVLDLEDKLLVFGCFNSYDNQTYNNLVSLNIDGSVNLDFNPGSGANGCIIRANVQSNGKIIIAGSFTEYNGIQINNIARLNADGTLDNTFNIVNGFNNGNTNYISDMLIRYDKIILVGTFVKFNGIDVKNILRLNSNGSLDLSFNHSITGVNDSIRVIREYVVE
jgi:uncharacterized delta-60 repeat protein